MKLNIRLKILIGFAVLLTLSTIVQGVSFLITQQYVSIQIANFQREQVRKGANEVEKFFAELNKNSYGLAQVYTKDKASVDSSTMFVIKNNDYIKKIAYLSKMGREVTKFDYQGKVPQDKLSYEVPSEPFYSAMAGTSAVSKVYYLEKSLGPHIDLFTPIFGNGRKVEGVIKTQISLSQLGAILKDIKLGPNGYIYIVDNEGRLLTHPTDSYVLQRPNLSSRNIVSDYQRNEYRQESYEYVNEKNVKVLAQANKIFGYEWIAVFEQPVNESYGFLDLIFKIFIFTIGGSLVILLVLAFLISEDLTRSIRKLQISAKQVEQGQHQKVDIIKSGDEIESLSYSFSSLVNQLLDREHSLQNITIQLEKANKKLQQLDVLKNEFVSVASHELRTPMTSIKSYLWMALQGKGGELSEKQRYYVQRSYNSVDRLVRLVNDMLNISRIESGSIQLTMQAVDLNHVAGEVIEEVQPKARELGITVIMQENHELPPVLADFDKMKEIFFNLIGNSLKFTPKGGSITVKFNKNGDFVETHITDTGVGIDAEDIGKLFQKFGLMPGSYVTNQKAEGTGLGLYICRSIVEQHMGRIWADSEGKGKGSTFSFKLKIFSTEDQQKYNEEHEAQPSTERLIHNEV